MRRGQILFRGNVYSNKGRGGQVFGKYVFPKTFRKIFLNGRCISPLSQIIFGHDTVASRCRLYITLYILSHDGPSTTFPSMTVAPPTPTDD